MEKVLFKRPCIYKGHLIEQITVSYPNRFSEYYCIGGFVNNVYIHFLTDHYPRENKKSIMETLIRKYRG